MNEVETVAAVTVILKTYVLPVVVIIWLALTVAAVTISGRS